MLKFLNHKTGKLIATEQASEIPMVGLAVTGWEQISTEIFNKLINPEYNFPSWNYYMIKLATKVRANPDNKGLKNCN